MGSFRHAQRKAEDCSNDFSAAKSLRLSIDFPSEPISNLQSPFTKVSGLSHPPLIDIPQQATHCAISRFLRPLHRWHHCIGELFTQLDAPLIERVDAPNHALHEHLVLVESDQFAERSWTQPREKKNAARSIARMHFVRN